MTCIFSVDVEDWFHILDVPSAPPLSAWDSLPARVEQNFHRLLDLFSEQRVQTTCFFLGYVAERFPHLVKEAAARGHEIASHGYAHRLVYEQTADEFCADVMRAKKILEDLTSQPLHGYRSPGFSVIDETPWFFEKLVEAGYRYDSSVFPAARGHGGLRRSRFEPHTMETPAGPLVEVPITVARVFGKPLCFFGGGYLRLAPYRLIRAMTRKVLAEGRPVVFYIHPREIDPDHPRLPMSLKRRFKTYVNLRTTHSKLRRVLDDFRPTTFAHYLSEAGLLVEELSCPRPRPRPFSTPTPTTSTPSTAMTTRSSTG